MNYPPTLSEQRIKRAFPLEWSLKYLIIWLVFVADITRALIG